MCGRGRGPLTRSPPPRAVVTRVTAGISKKGRSEGGGRGGERRGAPPPTAFPQRRRRQGQTGRRGCCPQPSPPRATAPPPAKSQAARRRRAPPPLAEHRPAHPCPPTCPCPPPPHSGAPLLAMSTRVARPKLHPVRGHQCGGGRTPWRVVVHRAVTRPTTATATQRWVGGGRVACDIAAATDAPLFAIAAVAAVAAVATAATGTTTTARSQQAGRDGPLHVRKPRRGVSAVGRRRSPPDSCGDGHVRADALGLPSA